MLNITILCE